MGYKKKVFCMVLLVASFLFTGCGEKMYTLTDQEAATISDYAAKIVAKYNKRAKGICYVVEQSEDTSNVEENAVQEQQTEENDGNTSQTNMDTDVESMSLQEALGVEGVAFTYDGFQMAQEYKESDYVVLTPESGNSYLVMNFSATNNTQQPVTVDLLSKNLLFRVTAGQSSASAETTILLNDLSTYKGEVAAGETAHLVLLFQLKTQDVQEVSQVQLQLKQEGTLKNITL